ncbi:MAG: Transglutaminase-like domain protein, partial [uncultured Acetobacteraceae bacterium]
AAPRRPPRHDLPLPPSRRLRRAPHDAPPARRARPAHPGGPAGDHPGARGPALAARRVRQQRGRRPLLRPRRRVALRQLRAPRPPAERRRRPAPRPARGDVAVLLWSRGGDGPRPHHRAPLPRPGPRGGPLGAPVHARERADGHAGGAVRDHPRHPPRVRLHRSGGRRHPSAGPDAEARQRHLPRLRGADDGGGAFARLRGAVRLRLPLLAGARRQRARRRRRHPRLGSRVPARRRLGGVRSDQRHRRQPRPDPGRRGAAGVAGGAAGRHLDRLPVGQPRDGRGGPRHLRGAGGGRRGGRERERAGARPRRGGAGL